MAYLYTVSTTLSIFTLAASYWQACYYPQYSGGRCMKGYSGIRFCVRWDSYLSGRPSLISDLSSRTEVKSRSAVRSLMLESTSWNQTSAEHQSESAVHLLHMRRALSGWHWCVSLIFSVKLFIHFYRVRMKKQNYYYHYLFIYFFLKLALHFSSWSSTNGTSWDKEELSHYWHLIPD